MITFNAQYLPWLNTEASRDVVLRIGELNLKDKKDGEGIYDNKENLQNLSFIHVYS